jgi:iron complex outermembrane receptor protein
MTVPLAVTAISAADIEQRGIKDIAGVAAFTPSFRFQNQSVGRNDRGFKQYVIRGIVPNSALATRQAASLFVDGAPVAGGNLADLSDIERIETIKGPQSATFGRSTFAGAINVVTRAPRFEWHGAVDADVAGYGTTNVTGSLEGPVVNDRLAFRIGARAYHTDGFYSNVGSPGEKLGERSTKAASIALLFTPTDKLSLRTVFNLWNDSDGTLPANARFTGANFNCNAGLGVGGAQNYICGELSEAPTDTRRWDTTIDPTALLYLQGLKGTGYTLNGANFITHPGLERDAWQARVSAQYQLPAGYTLSALAASGYNKWGFLQTTAFINNHLVPNPFVGRFADVLPYNYSLILGNTDDKDRTFELRLDSPHEAAFHWSFGGTYAYERTDNLTTVFGNTGYLLATPHTINQSDTYGVFGSASYALGAGVTLTAEGRYQRDELFQTTLAGSNPAFSDTFNSFTPRVIAEWQFAPGQMAYVSWSRGSRPGEFNTIYFAQTPAVQAQIAQQANVQGSVPEDKLNMGELGVKGMFLDNRVRLLADVYFGKWTNRHIPNFVTFLDANGLQQSIQVTAPNGEVKLSGFEFEGAWKPIDPLTLEATLGIAKTEIEKTFCTDCQVTTGNSTPVGTQLPYYPKTSGTVSATWEHPAFGGWMGSVRADAIYTGKIYESEANLAWTKPATTVNLRFGVEKEGYRFELYGTNIFDDKTPTSLARTAQTLFSPTGATAGTQQGITVSLPDRATYGIRMKVSF